MSRDAACLHVCLLFRLRLRGFVFVVHAAKEVLAVRHVSVVVVVVCGGGAIVEPRSET